MNDESYTNKEIEISNKTEYLRHKIFDIFIKEQDEFIKLGGSQKSAIFMSLTVAFTVYVRMVACCIHLKLFDKKQFLEELTKDFFKKVDENLEEYKKKDY